MSDLHGRDGRDLPSCPKAKVIGRRKRWSWSHKCPWHGHMVVGAGYETWAEAFATADKHMRHCEVS